MGPPRLLLPSASRRQICWYSISAFLCALLVCFFFVDTEMIYRTAGFSVPASATSASNLGFGQPAHHSLMNSPTAAGEEVTKEEETVAKEEESTVIEEEEIVAKEPELKTKEEEKADMDVILAGEGEEVTVEDEPALVAEIKRDPEGKKNSLLGCDLSVGQWVYDNVTYPLYRARNCPFVDEGFQCAENGRPDLEWMSYHWKPHGCDLPSWNATDILERLRGQRVVFVGDSLGRNNWESLLCMLAEGVSDMSKIYEVNGEPITKHSGKLVYRFADYNCTVEYYRDPFLVPQTRPPQNSSADVKCVLKVDHVSWTVGMWWNADIIIFNAGHWWTADRIFRQWSCQFQEGDKLKPEYDVPTGLKKALHTWAAWLEEHLDARKSQVFWLSYPTTHFRGGTWNLGGRCDEERRPLTEEEVRAEWQTPWMNQVVLDEFMGKLKKLPVTYLDITTATNYRSDGHGALYAWDTKKFSQKRRDLQDCSHFCLPGVPDAWNELILASLFVQGKGTWAHNPWTL